MRGAELLFHWPVVRLVGWAGEESAEMWRMRGVLMSSHLFSALNPGGRIYLAPLKLVLPDGEHSCCCLWMCLICSELIYFLPMLHFFCMNVNSESFQNVTVPSDVSRPFLVRFQAPNECEEGENNACKDFIPSMSNSHVLFALNKNPRWGVYVSSLSVTFLPCLHVLAPGLAHRLHLCCFSSRGWKNTQTRAPSGADVPNSSAEIAFTRRCTFRHLFQTHLPKVLTHAFAFFLFWFCVVTKYCCSFSSWLSGCLECICNDANLPVMTQTLFKPLRNNMGLI